MVNLFLNDCVKQKVSLMHFILKSVAKPIPSTLLLQEQKFNSNVSVPGCEYMLQIHKQ